jgi:hypothetical protein
MQIRYLGFEQLKNARAYRFDVVEKGQPNKEFTVTADLALFLEHHVGIQEGPSLCASKLTADLENSCEGEHQLTSADLRAHADARTAEEHRRAEARRSGVRRSVAPATPHEHSPWRNSAT